MDLVLEMMPHPFFQGVCGPVTVQDLAHTVVNPQGKPILARSIVRIRVDHVGNWAFLRESLGKSIARDHANCKLFKATFSILTGKCHDLVVVDFQQVFKLVVQQDGQIFFCIGSKINHQILEIMGQRFVIVVCRIELNGRELIRLSVVGDARQLYHP